eukprot:GHVP01020681.1.p1 GENE.GHVP01020681.1~~GHVP01020681.1.p1  ORF type:complete len:153 (+),score=24.15 GHVP01020681.1:210-668(+)
MPKRDSSGKEVASGVSSSRGLLKTEVSDSEKTNSDHASTPPKVTKTDEDEPSTTKSASEPYEWFYWRPLVVKFKHLLECKAALINFFKKNNWNEGVTCLEDFMLLKITFSDKIEVEITERNDYHRKYEFSKSKDNLKDINQIIELCRRDSLV